MARNNKQCKCLSEHDLKLLCDKIIELLYEENNVQPISNPVIICWDIHGQFYDLMNLFEKGCEVPDQENMEIQIHGDILTIYLIICL